MNILVHFEKPLSRNIKGQYDSYLKFLALDEQNHYFFINKYKKETLLKIFPSIKNIKNFTFVNLNTENLGWKEYYQSLDEVIEKNKIDRYVVIFKNINREHRSDIPNKNESYYQSTLADDNFLRSFNILFGFIKNNVTDYYINEIKGIKSIHVINDPQECQYIQDHFYFYEVPSQNIKRLPYIEYGFFYGKFPDMEKKHLLTFGATIVAKHRKWVYDNLLELEKNPKFKIFYKNNFEDVDTLIKHEDYKYLVGSSKYTISIPSYDSNHFSSVRFFEALSTKTIPLILKGTNIDLGLQHYPELLEIMRDYVLDFSEMEEFIERDDYETSINRILSCKDLIMLKGRSFYEESFKEFFAYK